MHWNLHMEISAGEKDYKLVGEQARRIFACRLTFVTEVPGAELRQTQFRILLTPGVLDAKSHSLTRVPFPTSVR